MDTMEAIFTRTTVRQFLDQPIPDEALTEILKAGMSGPSCVNARDWAFLVVRSKDTLRRMAEANGRPADPIRGAAVGILVCGDLSRSFRPAPDYWIIDGAIAGLNMILAAHSMGIGSVWLGTYPQTERVNAQKALFSLPEHMIPHTLLALGYPDTTPHSADPDRPPMPPKPKFEEDRVHYEAW